MLRVSVLRAEEDKRRPFFQGVVAMNESRKPGQVGGWGSQGPILNNFKVLVIFCRFRGWGRKGQDFGKGIDGQGIQETSRSDFETRR